jgi:HSP20 family protein
MAPDRDLFANFERVRREIDELFGDALQRAALSHRRQGFTPPVDVAYTETPPQAVVTVAVPGMDLRDIEIEIRGRELVIAGHRRAGEANGCVYQQVEIEHGPFRRVISLGADLLAERARATYEDGMLRVEIPLAAADAPPRTVPIKAHAEPGPGQGRGA